MRLSTSELRARASAFVAAHQGFGDEMRDTQTFYNDFFYTIFGVRRERVATYERSVERLGRGRGRIDLFWPGELIVEQKSLGRDLLGARRQALDYLHNLTDDELPKRVLVSDFRTFELTDLAANTTHAFTLEDLPKNIEKFSFILGRQTVRFKDQDPVNIKASELVGLLHDRLEASGYTGHPLEVFLTRLVFCLFADDTGIFEPRDILWDYLDSETKPDGSDTGDRLGALFHVLNTPEDQRQKTLAPELARFPYVNGDLFAEYFPPPAFDADMRAALLNACRFDWTPISPAIFGSLFQSVMDKTERRRQGAHYTTEKNILKLIGPLFLDDLRAEFDRLRALKSGRAQRLAAFHDRLANLTFFDPACGCGNFLIIAYRELRMLELDLLLEMRTDSQLTLDAAALSRVDVDQFYGIEISEFPARIAQTAMWMMDHLMNLRLSEAFGNYLPRIPLKKAPTIRHGDALEIDWASVLPPNRCSYVLGNPPFYGSKEQSDFQRNQVKRIVASASFGGTLDYVSAWFLKAGAYVQGTTRIGFVATNSITQGEQVAQLWPILFDRYGLEIAFAHRTFRWTSEARGTAQVHPVIIGLDRRSNERTEKRLFSYPNMNSDPIETVHKVLSPYLFGVDKLQDRHTTVRKEPKPINGLPNLVIGSKPIDGGYYIFSKSELDAFLAVEPAASSLFVPFVGSREFLHGEERYILHVGDVAPGQLRSLRKVREVIAQVRRFRLGEIPAKRLIGDAHEIEERGISSKLLAETPSRFHVTVVPDVPFLVVPETGSNKREYLPLGFLGPPTIPSNLVKVGLHANLWQFGLLSSKAHFAWMNYIGGRMKSDPRYSIGVVYNTFPLPPGGPANPALRKFDPLAQAILDARAAHPGATLADLYDPDLMPPNLRAAHTALDRAVDRLYRPSGFASDRERVEHLFTLYEAMAAPLLAGRGAARRGRKPRPAAG